MAEDFEDEEYSAGEKEEEKKDIEEELENDEVADWEEGFSKGEEAAEYQEGEIEEASEEKKEGEEETPKKKKKHEEEIPEY